MTPSVATQPRQREFQIVDVFWKEERGRLGWSVASPTPDEVSIGTPPAADLRLPVRDALARFDRWLAGSKLLRWWPLAAADGDEDKVFVLRHFPDGIWQIPWELLVHRLKDGGRSVHRRVSLARGLDEPIPEAPDRFAEALRVLVVTGQPAGLDLEHEVEELRAAWRGLGDEARRRVEEPRRLELTPSGLAAGLRDRRPHILWFTGHGRRREETELLAADGTWIGAKRLAGLIAESEETPLYTVFWACDTGSGQAPSTAGAAFTPDLFERLRRIGVMSAIVAQAPIGEKISRLIARELFNHLAGGYSLSRGLARARARVLDELSLEEENERSLDWAAPMLWTSGRPVAALEWTGSTAVRRQLLGEELFRSPVLATTPEEVDVDRPPAPAEIARAEAWLSTPRTWILGDPEDPELRSGFLRALLALQASSPLSVLVVGGADLPRWAEEVHRWIRPDEQPSELVSAVAEIRDHHAGWQRLAALQGCCLAIVDPPVESAALRTSLAARTDPTIVLTAAEPGDRDDWVFDSLKVRAEPARLDALVAQAPQLARALSVCAMPLARKYLRLPGEETSIDAWDGWKELRVEIGWRFAMASSVRARVRKAMSMEEKQQAHWDCALMLGQLRRGLDTGLRILRHLLAAGEGEHAARHAGSLVEWSWFDKRPRLLLSILEQLGERQPRLPAEAAIFAAAAHVAVLDVTAAETWLKGSHPREAGRQAWQESLWSQVEKARGTAASYGKALRHIDDAIRLAAEAKDQRGHRDYRQDKALLLLHNFYRPQDAAAIYRELIQELEELDAQTFEKRDLGLQLAVIQRNYAECLRMLQDQGADVDDDPDEVLGEADELARTSMAPIRAEILYEQAKGAATAEESSAYLEKCLEVSREIGHPMMAAIADNRLFWTRGEFTLAAWTAHEKVLERFRLNAWAARTLMIGRLEAARRLQATEVPAARSQLEGNRRFIESFDIATAGRRDKARIAQTYAGLAVLTPKAGETDASPPWKRFLEWDWAPGWLAAQGQPEPEEIWQRKVE